MTDASGVATIYPMITQNPGNYALKAVFEGDGFYNLASQSQSAFEVIPDTGVLKVSSILPDTTKILRASEIGNIKIYFNEYVKLGSGKSWGDVVKITSLKTGTVLSGSYVYDETENVLTFTSDNGFSNNAEYQIQIDKAIAEVGGYYFKGYSSNFKTLMLASQGGVVEKNEIKIDVPANALSADGLVDVEKTANGFKEKMVYPLKTLEEGLNYAINIFDQNNSIISGASLQKPITIQAKYSDIVNPQFAIERKKASIYRNPWKASGTVKAQNLNTKTMKWYYYNPEKKIWEEIFTINDESGFTLSANVTKFGVYAVMGYAPTASLEDLSNYPNPFAAGREKTTIQYSLEKDSEIHIAIYDLMGNLVKTFHFNRGETGKGQANTLNQVQWDGRNGFGDVVANGGYIMRIEIDDGSSNKVKTRKILVIK
ncbi:MAG: Ig-like domain-containing protein [Elusimicrobia bacterium]|nr:Ig-like domain-containing protein [Elusimicrobiota bacterium]